MHMRLQCCQSYNCSTSGLSTTLSALFTEAAVCLNMLDNKSLATMRFRMPSNLKTEINTLVLYACAWEIYSITLTYPIVTLIRHL